MSKAKDKSTRRQFLQVAAAGGVGAGVASVRGGTAEAKPKGRGHYKVFQPGKIGGMELKTVCAVRRPT